MVLDEEGEATVSHPTGVRGLKYHHRTMPILRQPSHPTGVRGLKSTVKAARGSGTVVAPHWGAWIEIPTLESSSCPCSVAPITPEILRKLVEGLR